MRSQSIEVLWRKFADTGRPRIFKFLLAPFAAIWAFYAFIRNKLYDFNILKSSKPDGIVVISVGNLTVGGTGKTPLAIMIANLLKGKKGAILTRGYRREAKTGSLTVHPGEYAKHDPEETGDEPYLIAKKTKATVIIGKDRKKSLEEAARSGCEWALLDDGFQKRSIARDLDIVLNGRLGTGLCVPAGPLREPKTGLKRADLVLSTKWRVLYFSSETEKLSPQKGEPVSLFCGIGNPELFIESVKETGVHIENTLIVPDHKSPSYDDLVRLGGQKILCTEKDYIKLDARAKALPIFYVESELQIIQGKEILENALSSLF